MYGLGCNLSYLSHTLQWHKKHAEYSEIRAKFHSLKIVAPSRFKTLEVIESLRIRQKWRSGEACEKGRSVVYKDEPNKGPGCARKLKFK